MLGQPNKLLSFLSDRSIKEIISGSSWAFSLNLVAMVFGYVSTIIIANYFGPRTVGLLNLSYTVRSIIILISLLGFPTAILRFIGEYRDDYAQKIIIKKMVILCLSVSLLLGVVFSIYAEYISVKYFHDRRLEDFLYIILAGTPFVIIFSLLVAYFRGLRFISISESIRNSVVVFNLFFILFLVIALRGDDLSPAIANVCAAILTSLIAIIYSVKLLRRQNYKERTNVTYKKIFDVSLPMLISSSVFTSMSFVDKLMLGFFKTPVEVGIYSVAIKLATITSLILTAVNTIAAPKISELYWDNNIDELKKMIRFTSKIIFFFSFPVLSAYALFSHQILSLFGKEFMKGAVALLILSGGQFVNAASGTVGSFLDMTGHQNAFRNIVVLATIMNIILNYLMIPVYGYNGAALATAFSTILWNLLSLAYVQVRFKFFIGYIPLLK